MMLCLVTDRRRLAGTDVPFDRARACLTAQARHAAEAGVDLVQVRERDLPAVELAAIVRDIAAVVRGTRTRVLVNDRLDVALACEADGVQLRGDSLAVDAARRLAPPGFVIGRSVHSVEDAKASANADFLIAGTVFQTVSKDESAPLLGVEGLQAIACAVPIPVLAIGGVSEVWVERIAQAGAAGCAAIGLFMSGHGRSAGECCRAIPLQDVVERVRQRFDNSEKRSLT
jgi:thiamine-phosphate pyrophosphorylase